MKELFIPYELAVIAKQKGFNEQCFQCYIAGHLRNFDGSYSHNNLIPENWQAAPLYQQIVDWFREKQGIDIWVETYQDRRESHGIIDSVIPKVNGAVFGKGVYDEYYEALNKAIEKAFKLI